MHQELFSKSTVSLVHMRELMYSHSLDPLGDWAGIGVYSWDCSRIGISLCQRESIGIESVVCIKVGYCESGEKIHHT